MKLNPSILVRVCSASVVNRITMETIQFMHNTLNNTTNNSSLLHNHFAVVKPVKTKPVHFI